MIVADEEREGDGDGDGDGNKDCVAGEVATKNSSTNNMCRSL